MINQKKARYFLVAALVCGFGGLVIGFLMPTMFIGIFGLVLCSIAVVFALLSAKYSSKGAPKFFIFRVGMDSKTRVSINWKVINGLSEKDVVHLSEVEQCFLRYCQANRSLRSTRTIEERGKMTQEQLCVTMLRFVTRP